MKLSFLQMWTAYVRRHKSDFGDAAAFFKASDGRLCMVIDHQGAPFAFFFGHKNRVVWYAIAFTNRQLTVSGPYSRTTDYKRVSLSFADPETMRAAILNRQRALDLQTAGYAVVYRPVETVDDDTLRIALDELTRLLEKIQTPVKEPICLAEAYLIQALLKDQRYVVCDIDIPWYTCGRETLFHVVNRDAIASVQLTYGALIGEILDRPSANEHNQYVFNSDTASFVDAPDVSLDRFEADIVAGAIDDSYVKQLRRLVSRAYAPMRVLDPSVRRLDAALFFYKESVADVDENDTDENSDKVDTSSLANVV